MNKQLLVLAALTLFPACSAIRLTPNDFTTPPSRDAAAVTADANACDQKAAAERPSGFNDTLALETQYNKIYEECMLAKGYTRHY
jgi:hypothetical protein